MKLSGLGTFLTMLYDDKMDIYRTTSTINSDYSTDIFYQEEPLDTDVPCRISFSSDDSGSDSQVDMNPIRYNPKIFCKADVDIKAGDFIVLRRYADDGLTVKATYKGTVAQPSWYSTHQEALIRIDEGA